jgi:hypothetical protein
VSIQAPGHYRVDLYVREIGEGLNPPRRERQRLPNSKLSDEEKRRLREQERQILEEQGIPFLPPLENDWFMVRTTSARDTPLPQR